MKNIDILIKNGAVFDGTGAEPFEADIGVAGDKIALIDKNSKFKIQNSKKFIDAKGWLSRRGLLIHMRILSLPFLQTLAQRGKYLRALQRR